MPDRVTRSPAIPRQPLAGTVFSSEGKNAVRKISPPAGNASFPLEKPKRSKLGDPSVSPVVYEDRSERSASPDRGAFDLCPESKVFQLKRSMLEVNREDRNRAKSSGMERVRPGMILLKNHLSLGEQASIVRKCRELGIGPGGFYQPGYRDGAKLHLQMMCLGKNWDPQTREYQDIRSFDGAKPPEIPEMFKKLVERAMHASHDFIRKSCRGVSAEDELPNFTPDICIVNFYSSSGKLGLHQDRDESESSLHKGLPVVSFSVGDSADFLFGDTREALDHPKDLTLKSGDVLIFGGESRHVFHGISKIHSKSAPESLHKETNLRPGRLNLTFRQY